MTLPLRPIAALAGVATIATFAVASRGGRTMGGGSAPGVSDSTAALLVDLIRLNTSNPPGNTGDVAALLAPRFKARGFQVDIVQTPDSGKAHFIARLRGNGSKRKVPEKRAPEAAYANSGRFPQFPCRIGQEPFFRK